MFGTAGIGDNVTTADGGGGTTRHKSHVAAPNAIDARDGNGRPTAGTASNNPRIVQSPGITNAGCAFNRTTTTGSSNTDSTNNTKSNNAGTLAAPITLSSVPVFTGSGDGSVVTFASLSPPAIGLSPPAQAVTFAANANSAFLTPPQGTAAAELLGLSMALALPAGTAPGVAGLQQLPAPGPPAYNFAASVSGRGGASGVKRTGGAFGAGFGHSPASVPAPQATTGTLFDAAFPGQGLARRGRAQQPILVVPPGGEGVFSIGGSTVELGGRGYFRRRKIVKGRRPRPR